MSRAHNTLCFLVICLFQFANCQSASQKNADQPALIESANSALILPSACPDAARPGVLIASAPEGGYWRAERMQGSDADGVDGTSIYYSPVSYPCAWTHLTDLPGIHFWELDFIDAREGWASVQFLPNLDRGIYRTEDGGKHWTLSTRFSDQDHPREFIETYVWLNAIGASLAGYQSTYSFFLPEHSTGLPPFGIPCARHQELSSFTA